MLFMSSLCKALLFLRGSQASLQTELFRFEQKYLTLATDIQYFLVLLTRSMGKYVCHHAILTRDHGYYVGARRFTAISDVVDYFKDHPLGETFLKQEVRVDWLGFSDHSSSL